jgi:hypothetical protein
MLLQPTIQDGNAAVRRGDTDAGLPPRKMFSPGLFLWQPAPNGIDLIDYEIKIEGDRKQANGLIPPANH